MVVVFGFTVCLFLEKQNKTQFTNLVILFSSRIDKWLEFVACESLKGCDTRRDFLSTR